MIAPAVQSLVCGYAEALDESRGDVPLSQLFAGGLERYPDLYGNEDVAWIVGWLEGAATIAGMLPETLIERCRRREE